MNENPKPVNCPRCGLPPKMEKEYYTFFVYCEDCYDVDFDGEDYVACGPQATSIFSFKDAVDQWNDFYGEEDFNKED